MQATVALRDQSWWATSKSNKIKRALKYVRKFGLIQAVRLLSKTFLPYGQMIQVQLPQDDKPITLRSGTSDIYSFEKILIDREYDMAIPGNVQTIIDAGANIGCASIFFARKYPHATIVAIEPDPANFSMLVENTRAYANVQPVHAALWNKPGSLNLNNTERSPDSHQVEDGETITHSVRAITVGQILATYNFATIDLFKIDIESAEKELFESGYEPWLDTVKTIMIELHDRQKRGCSKSFYGAMVKYDFVQEIMGEVVTVIK